MGPSSPTRQVSRKLNGTIEISAICSRSSGSQDSVCKCSSDFCSDCLHRSLHAAPRAGRVLYQVSLLCAAMATALLVSPVAYHRWVFRRHEKARLLRYANVQAIVGLGMVAVAVCSAVWMVLLFIGLSWPTGLLAALATGCFVALWFVFPIADRIGADRRREKAH